jgi:hypothetical protein
MKSPFFFILRREDADGGGRERHGPKTKRQDNY